MPILLFCAAMLPLSAAAQSRAAPAGNLARAERAAVDLKQGMTLEEVRQLLGKPWRTALKTNGSAPGALSWTYTWNGGAATSERNLVVEFAAKTADDWIVSGWNWSTY